MPPRPVADEIRKWISPVLIAVLGMYGNSQLNRLDSIENKIDLLMDSKAGHIEKLKSFDQRLERLEHKVFQFTMAGLFFQITGVICELPPHPHAVVNNNIVLL